MQVSKNSKYQTHEKPKRQNWRAGTLSHFLTSIIAKHKKIEGGDHLVAKKSGKSLTMPKRTERGDLLGFFNIHFVAKHQKIEGGIIWWQKNWEKVSQCRKKLKGGPLSLYRYCMLRGKRGKTFLVQFATPNYSIWDHKIL